MTALWPTHESHYMNCHFKTEIDLHANYSCFQKCFLMLTTAPEANTVSFNFFLYFSFFEIHEKPGGGGTYL